MSGFGPEALIGKVIDGRYEVADILGSGGFGVVYKVVHRTLGKVQALKLLRMDATENSKIVQRFEREARATCQIGHENIIDITDFGADARHGHYFVMEYLDGLTLSQLLQNEGALPWQRALHIVKQIADALSATHAQGIIHRDLKPGNIFVLQRPRKPDFVKVLDFGIAHMKSSEGEERLTQAGMVLGSPSYMSPEQALGKPLDQRSDIYSLGIILFQMLMGQTPFQAASDLLIIRKHLRDAPPRFAEVRPDLVIPAEVERVILRALEKRPAARYQSMQALFSACERAERAALGGPVPAGAEATAESAQADPALAGADAPLRPATKQMPLRPSLRVAAPGPDGRLAPRKPVIVKVREPAEPPAPPPAQVADLMPDAAGDDDLQSRATAAIDVSARPGPPRPVAANAPVPLPAAPAAVPELQAPSDDDELQNMSTLAMDVSARARARFPQAAGAPTEAVGPAAPPTAAPSTPGPLLATADEDDDLQAMATLALDAGERQRVLTAAPPTAADGPVTLGDVLEVEPEDSLASTMALAPGDRFRPPPGDEPEDPNELQIDDDDMTVQDVGADHALPGPPAWASAAGPVREAGTVDEEIIEPASTEIEAISDADFEFTGEDATIRAPGVQLDPAPGAAPPILGAAAGLAADDDDMQAAATVAVDSAASRAREVPTAAAPRATPYPAPRPVAAPTPAPAPWPQPGGPVPRPAPQAPVAPPVLLGDNLAPPQPRPVPRMPTQPPGAPRGTGQVYGTLEMLQQMEQRSPQRIAFYVLLPLLIGSLAVLAYLIIEYFQ